MTMVKKTVTLDADVVQGATELGEGNFSAYVNDAVARQVRRDRLAKLADELAAEFGPVPEADIVATLASIDAVSGR